MTVMSSIKPGCVDGVKLTSPEPDVARAQRFNSKP